MTIPHPIDVHVGKRIILLRMQLGLTQDVVSKRIGVSFQQLQKYEKGTNRLSSSRLYDLAQALSVPVSFFFEDVGAIPQMVSNSKNISFPSVSTIPHREVLEMIRAYSSLKPLVRKSVSMHIKALALQED